MEYFLECYFKGNSVTFNEILKRLQSEKIKQTSCLDDFLEDVSKDLYELIKELNFKPIADGLDVDKRRWYNISTTVFEPVEGRYLGVQGVSHINSESMTYSDIENEYEFFEMQKISKPTFVKVYKE